MTSIAEIHGGTVHKFLGDGPMGFFGDPESEGPVADAYACVAMAVAMRDQLICLADELGHYTLHIRIGIRTGYCVVGGLGQRAGRIAQRLAARSTWPAEWRVQQTPMRYWSLSKHIDCFGHGFVLSVDAKNTLRAFHLRYPYRAYRR